MLYLFVVDTSVSMNQAAENGMSYLDFAKAGVEQLVNRSRMIGREKDRHFLFTCGEGPAIVKSGWDANPQEFLQILRNLQAREMTSIDFAIQKALDFVNRRRLMDNIDQILQGRFICNSVPAAIIVFTDSGAITNRYTVSNKLILPISNVPGANFFREPFRWDQRIFAFICQRHGVKELSPQRPDSPPILSMCTATLGRHYFIRTMKDVHQFCESISKRLTDSVTAKWSAVSDRRLNCSTLLHIPGNQHIKWPIPENFVVDSSLISIPPRSAKPHLVVNSSQPFLPIPPNAFPLTNIEVEAGSPIAETLLQTGGGKAWKVHIMSPIPGSSQMDLGASFGWVMASRPNNPNIRASVYLVLAPYNYEQLFPHLIQWHKREISQEAIARAINNYLSTLPPYYVSVTLQALNLWSDRVKQVIPSLTRDAKPMKSMPEELLRKIRRVQEELKIFERNCREEERRCQPSTQTVTESKPQNPQQNSINPPFRTKHYFEHNTSERGVKSLLFSKSFGEGPLKVNHQVKLLPKTESILPRNNDPAPIVPIAEMSNYQKKISALPPPLRRAADQSNDDPRVKKVSFGNPYRLSDNKSSLEEIDEGHATREIKQKRRSMSPGPIHRNRQPKQRSSSAPPSMIFPNQPSPQPLNSDGRQELNIRPVDSLKRPGSPNTPSVRPRVDANLANMQYKELVKLVRQRGNKVAQQMIDGLKEVAPSEQVKMAKSLIDTAIKFKKNLLVSALEDFISTSKH